MEITLDEERLRAEAEEKKLWDFSEKLISIQKRGCPDCMGTGKMRATNIPVDIPCDKCKGSGKLKDNDEVLLRRTLQEEIQKVADNVIGSPAQPAVVLVSRTIRSTLTGLVSNGHIHNFSVDESPGDDKELVITIQLRRYQQKTMRFTVGFNAGG
jgi:hypothetical protein